MFGAIVENDIVILVFVNVEDSNAGVFEVFRVACVLYCLSVDDGEEYFVDEVVRDVKHGLVAMCVQGFVKKCFGAVVHVIK